MDNLKKIFDTNYLVFNNGVLEETDTSLSSLTFDEPMKVKVINRFSKDTKQISCKRLFKRARNHLRRRSKLYFTKRRYL